MQNGNGSTPAERISKGIAVTQAAIENRDAKTLRACIGNFAKLGAPAQQIYEAVQLCPMDLATEALNITIDSDLLGRRITIGKDISWPEVSRLRIAGVRGDELKTVMAARTEFGGTIESIIPDEAATSTQEAPAPQDEQQEPEPDLFHGTE